METYPFRSWRTPEASLRYLLLGIQHVLVMYAGTVAVPIFIGEALRLPTEQVAYLINADLLIAGALSTLQSLGWRRWGIRLPVMMGVSFASVAPVITIASMPGLGLPTVYGSVALAGALSMIAAPAVARLYGKFPPLVIGTMLSLIGLSLLHVAIGWVTADASAPNLQLAGVVLIMVVVVHRFCSAGVRRLAVLLGMLCGCAVAASGGHMHIKGWNTAHWLAWVHPLHFGYPRFDPAAVLCFCLVMVVNMIESLGVFAAVAQAVGRPLNVNDWISGLRVDALGAVLGGLFNTFTYTTFAQNAGLVAVTAVRSARVTTVAGVILMLLGLCPKLALVVASIPFAVLGAAGLVIFGCVAATGMRIIGTAREQPEQSLLVALSLAVGLTPSLAPSLLVNAPAWSAPVLHSGIVLGTLTALLLHLLLRTGRATAVQATEVQQGQYGAEPPH
jgi:NCS2 family nucleobase:cation symporter-2